MKRYPKMIVAAFMIVLTAIACGSGSGLDLGGETVTISVVYGSEKEEWLETVAARFNEQRIETEEGARIVVETTPQGSISSMRDILDGVIQPTVWSPASSIYIPLANEEWRAANGEDLTDSNPEQLVLSPVVIAMWRPMAEALGWPNESIGWADIAEFSASDEGWQAYGRPEWGTFKLGHTHPEFSNSGFTSVLAEIYAGTGKQRDLTMADLQDPEVIEFVEAVERSIIHYGSSTGFFAERMFNRGPSYLSAAVMYENLIVAQEADRIAGISQQIPVVAIYPEEGTFWSDHPYAVLNASWVTEDQREAAAIFQDYLLADEQQRETLRFGFRPADPNIPLTSPLDAQHGVDINQPQTILEVPDSEVLRGAWDLWRQAKKPVDLIVLMDTSGSMQGQKIASARSSLIEFITLLDDRDRLQVITFNELISELTPLGELGPKRQDLTNRVGGIFECCGTSLYDAILMGYEEMEANGDPAHIRAIVVLSDGEDTQSEATLNMVISTVGDLSEGGNATKVFTIGYGSDVDQDILTQIAESTGARSFESSPETIMDIYRAIATFF